MLFRSIVGLGGESDQVKVAAGYARNYLLPQGLAIPLTHANKRRLEVLGQRRAEREAHEYNAMSELAKSLSKLVCQVKVKTGEDGKLFGAVTTGMIADELKHQFDVSLDKKKIYIENPIRTLGDHEIELHLHPEVKGKLQVRVESTTPVTVPPPEAVSLEPKKEEGRPDRRGRRDGDKGEASEAKSRMAKGEKTSKADKPGKVEKVKAGRAG